jgi:predicted ATPase
MINLLKLKNFKAFENLSLELKNLTLMTGLNGMGKSSVLQSLLLLRQSYQQRLLTQGLALNGDLVKIGTGKDALFEGAETDEISIEIGFDKKLVSNLNWIYQYDRQSDVIAAKSTPSVIQEIHYLSLFNDLFHYLQSERLGPRTVYPMSDYAVGEHFQIGISGEYTSHFLSLFGDREIHTIGNIDRNTDSRETTKKQPKPTIHPRSTSLKLLNVVEAWLGEISPGTRLKIVDNPDIDLMNLQYSFAVNKELTNQYRATNVGFGISYVLPIIVAVLASPPGSIVLIENPEAYLHPKGQSKIGELLALAASYGVQIILETHSDHVLNGIRLAVHDGKISPEDVQLHYFYREDKKGNLATEVISPNIDRRGRIDRWPDGFFDEWEKTLDNLLEPVKE